MVVSFDYTTAIDANYKRNGHQPNVLLVQADIFHIPCRLAAFDFVFCFGVLQHTPDPARAFASLPPLLKAGGQMAIDVYRLDPWWRQWPKTKYWIRRLPVGMENERLYAWVNRWIRLMWPISRLVHYLPGGRYLNAILLVPDWRGVYEFDDATLREWAILDCFDMLSPAYDLPQSRETVRTWYQSAGMDEIDVHFGHNGIEGRGRAVAAGKS
jgi:SAM-dependent methyltransferase